MQLAGSSCVEEIFKYMPCTTDSKFERMKYSLKTFFLFSVVVSLVVVTVYNLRLPGRVIEVRASLRSTEVGCERVRLLKQLKLFQGQPLSSTLDDDDTSFPHFLLETWQISANYEVAITYQNEGGEIVFCDSLIYDNRQRPMPDGNFVSIFRDTSERGHGLWSKNSTDCKQE